MTADRITAFAAALERTHATLRERLATVRQSLADASDLGPQADLLAHCTAFCAAVRTHHGAEDGGLLTALAEDVPTLRPQVAKLAEDHALVADLLVRVEALVARATPDPVGRTVLLRELDGLAAILASHFAFEERTVAGWTGPSVLADWVGDVLHPDPVLRATARVLLVDGQERTLLFSGTDEDGRTFWFPPGGAVEPGESDREAAVRELVEEAGWAQATVGPLIGTRRHVVGWEGVGYDVRETWFLARVDRLDVDTSGWTDLERATMGDGRWWSPSDLATAIDRLVPADLAALVVRILRDGPPDPPLTLGI